MHYAVICYTLSSLLCEYRLSSLCNLFKNIISKHGTLFAYSSFIMAYKPRNITVGDNDYFHAMWQCHNKDWLIRDEWAKPRRPLEKRPAVATSKPASGGTGFLLTDLGIISKFHGCLLESVALALKLEYITMMQKPVQYGGGNGIISQTLSPILDHPV